MWRFDAILGGLGTLGATYGMVVKNFNFYSAQRYYA
jgi:hypothetical protein